MTEYYRTTWRVRRPGIGALPGLWDTAIDVGCAIWYALYLDRRRYEHLQITICAPDEHTRDAVTAAFEAALELDRWQPVQPRDAVHLATESMQITGRGRLRDLPPPIFDALMETLAACAAANDHIDAS